MDPTILLQLSFQFQMIKNLQTQDGFIRFNYWPGSLTVKIIILFWENYHFYKILFKIIRFPMYFSIYNNTKVKKYGK